MNVSRLVVAAVLTASFSAFAQAAKPAEPAKKEAGPPMPTLPAEGKKWVEGHLGNWKAAEVAMTMGDKTAKGKMNLDCKKASAGWATLCTGKADMGKEMPLQEVVFLFGWNIGDGTATMFEVSNMGEVHAHTGKWNDDKSATVVHEGKNAEGVLEKDTLTFTWVSAKELAIKAEGTAGGKTLWTFTATAKK